MRSRKTGEEIMSAVRPEEIFSMDPELLEQEKDEYLEQFKPEAYNTIKNFMVTQKVLLLYQQALESLKGRKSVSGSYGILELSDGKSEVFKASYQYMYNIQLGVMYVTDKNIVMVIESKYDKYYRNFINKTKDFPHLNKNVWSSVEYSLPKVTNNFKDTEGNWIIILEKPYTMYPLKEIFNYFGGKLQPEYVASILTRLYNFVCYLDLIGIHHNGITVENLFFAPGKIVEEGEKFSLEDMRIVGVYGGWFFSTYSDEKIRGMPKKIKEGLNSETIKNGYSSFEVDELSIKQVARELLGDITGENLEGVPIDFSNWVNNLSIRKNAYEEFTGWEKARGRSFGKHRFVPMDVSKDLDNGGN